MILHVRGGPESHVSNSWVTYYSRAGQVGAARGFAVFYPNYRGSTGRGVEFSKLGQADAAGREFDDLVDAVDALVEAASFYAGLAGRVTAEAESKPHRPAAVFHYMQHDIFEPRFIVDVTAAWLEPLPPRRLVLPDVELDLAWERDRLSLVAVRFELV